MTVKSILMTTLIPGSKLTVGGAVASIIEGGLAGAGTILLGAVAAVGVIKTIEKTYGINIKDLVEMKKAEMEAEGVTIDEKSTRVKEKKVKKPKKAKNVIIDDPRGEDNKVLKKILEAKDVTEEVES